MKLMMQNCDFLILGSGIAGLSAALRVPVQNSVIILTKGSVPEGSTIYAQGGIASVTDPEDNYHLHVEDTLTAGAGLCRCERVETLVQEGPAAIQTLLGWGVEFTPHQEDPSRFHLALEGGHSRKRILHTRDLTGEEIMRALLIEVRNRSNINFLEYAQATELITEANSCLGCSYYNSRTHEQGVVKAHHTLLATGGSGQVYSYTTNPPVSNGDGNALAWRAGAYLEDMEFMQFHPTAFYNSGGKSFLISEALRGHGGVLKNQLGEEFMQSLHPLAHLAPRDIVARGIFSQMQLHDTPCVFLDCTHMSDVDLRHHFPGIYEMCARVGLNISQSPIPVSPAAHYMCGGVKVDEWSASSVKNLYAIGETACTGVHGANRLASNSLLESVVFSLRAVDYCVKQASGANLSSNSPLHYSKITYLPAGSTSWDLRIQELRSWMWQSAGIFRTTSEMYPLFQRLEVAYNEQVAQISALHKIPLQQLNYFHMLINAQAITKAALARKESRGLHSVREYPHTLPQEAYHRAWSLYGMQED
jgi:L-aspartate oxidase